MSREEVAASMYAPALGRPAKQFIVLVALLQALLLYLADYGRDAGVWPFATLSGCVYWYTLVLSVPTVLLLSVERLDDRRFWWQGAGVAGVFALLAAWAGWSATGNAGIEAGAVLTPFGASLAAALFVALPYLQTALRHRRWSAHYPDLFEFAWQNALTLLLMLVFTGICWLLLQLWGGLFKLIGISFFKELFEERPFVYLATGLMAGLGILIGRTQQRPVHIARRVVFAIFTGLLPLVALIALLFVASLPFTGLEPLWETGSAALVLMTFIWVMLLFANAVYQDGQRSVAYPKWLRHVVAAGLLTLPVFAVLALYALALRIGQHGWTQERIAATVLALVLALHAFGYAIAVLRRGAWLAGIRRVNVVVSLLAMVLAGLFNSPLLDPHRITANSQIARLEAGKVAGEAFDIEHLRFKSGRQGWRALQALGDSPTVRVDEKLADRLQAVLKRESRYQNTEELFATALQDRAGLQRVVKLAEGSPAPAEDWWAHLLADKDYVASNCKQGDSDCVVLVRDFDRDGEADTLLCNVKHSTVQCTLFARHEGSWQAAGGLQVFAPYDEQDAVKAALRRGEITLLQPRWPTLEVGGQRVQFSSKSPQAHTPLTPQ